MVISTIAVIHNIQNVLLRKKNLKNWLFLELQDLIYVTVKMVPKGNFSPWGQIWGDFNASEADVYISTEDITEMMMIMVCALPHK